MFRKIIREEIERFVPVGTAFSVEVPEIAEHGDYASNVAMVLGKKEGKNPREVAEELKTKLLSFPVAKWVEKIDIAGPGFLNFFIAPKALIFSLRRPTSKQGFFEKMFSKKKKVMVEYTDPNPFKEFHIGHLMSNTIGEAICRIIEASGTEVKRANYYGDVGMHIAYAVTNLLEEILRAGGFKEWAKDLSSEELGRLVFNTYTAGVKKAKESEEFLQRAKEVNKKIYEQSDELVNKIYALGLNTSLVYFEKVYEIIGMQKRAGGKHFDFYFPESEVWKTGQSLVENGLKRGVFEKSDGAVVFRGEKFGLHTRIFVNSAGFPTYEAKELGLAIKKAKKYKFDFSITITGNEIKDYFKVVLKAMEKVGMDTSKIKHITHGMMRFKEGKMSSRTGDIITTEQFMNDVEKVALDKIKTNENIPKDAQTGIARKITLGAIKYSILKHSIGSDIIFEPEKSVSFEGDTGPYLQYTYARIRSILRKHGGGVSLKSDFQVEVVPVEKQILLAISRFDEILEDALADYMPNILVNYLFSLAQKANEFYHSHPVLQEENKQKKEFRLALIFKIAETLKKGLYLLGIDAPEVM